ncbi:MAG: hypothetical protein BWX74_00546 [Tenericutes bacterium ADurb.Bin087]|nr:MAG: hypothetical protein BWX74_00546 [Tenericutes bacterium ADurb.Bin087]
MKKRKLFILPLFFALLLTGCDKGGESQTSQGGGGGTTSQTGGGGDTSSQGGTSTSQGGESSEATHSLEDMGFTQHQGWPTSLIADFLSRNSITDPVPALGSVGKTYYAMGEEGSEYDYFALVIPGADRASEYKNKVNGEGYTIKQIEKAYAGVSRSETIGITFGYVKSNTKVPDSLYIYLTPNTPGSFGLHKLEKATGWPNAAINQYLAGQGVTDTLPALTNVSTSYHGVISDQGENSMAVFVPGGDRVEEYGAILLSEGFSTYMDIYFNQVGTIMVMGIYLAPDDFAIIEGTMFVIMASPAAE